MSWFTEKQRNRRKTFIYLKKNYRVGKKVKTKRIYLGPMEIAIDILSDLQTKPLIDEKLMTYSGETILGKIADSIDLTQALVKYTKKEKDASILRSIIVLRALFGDVLKTVTFL